MENAAVVECRVAGGAANQFCALLDDRDRRVLCEHCVCRNMPRSAMMLKDEMRLSIYFVIEGLIVTDTPFDENAYFNGVRPGLGIMVRGDVFSCDLVCNEAEPDDYRYYLNHASSNPVALVPSVLGRVPVAVVRQLFGESVDFARKLFQRNIEMFGRTCEFASALRAGGAQDSVKFLLCFAKRHGISLTHEQIASLTRRNRSTVSKILADLPRSDSAFFRRLEFEVGEEPV